MSAEIIPLGRMSKSRARRSAEEAWEYFDEAARECVRLINDPNSTGRERMLAGFEAARRHRLFMNSYEAML